MKKLFRSIAIASVLTLGLFGLSATPVSSAPKAEAATLSNCFVQMNGRWVCYRSNCSLFEMRYVYNYECNKYVYVYFPYAA